MAMTAKTQPKTTTVKPKNESDEKNAMTTTASENKKPTFVICTVGAYEKEPPMAENYLEVTNKLKELYCERYNTVFYFSDNNPYPNRTGHWTKFPMLKQALKDSGADWAIWMDCDAAPVNHDLDVGEFLKTLDQGKIVMLTDILGWNSGVFAVPNTERAMQWLDEMASEATFKRFERAQFWDQDAIADSFNNGDYQDFVQQPPDYFGWNHFDDIYQWYKAHNKHFPNVFDPDKHWCLHIAGYGDCYRRKRFIEFHNRLSTKPCPVCNSQASKYFDVPMDKMFRPLTDEAEIAEYRPLGGDCDYYLCPHCDFIFAPMFKDWTDADFAEKIYNDQYQSLVDKLHGDGEAAKRHFNMFAPAIASNQARLLDYGSGDGSFGKMIEDKLGLWVDLYDPHYGEHREFKPMSRYTLITCFEVLEHVYNGRELFELFNRNLLDGGNLITSTQLHGDGCDNPSLYATLPTEWDNIAPRNGHVCMYSHKALAYLAASCGFVYLQEKSSAFYQTFKKVRSI